MVKFSARHPEFEFSRYVIPQVPGSEARSTPVHGVVESFFKSKKYIVPSAVASPIFAGCVAAVYVGTVAGRFDPARRRWFIALIAAWNRRSARKIADPSVLELNHLVSGSSFRAGPRGKNTGTNDERCRTRLSIPTGDPVLIVRMGDEAATVGLAPENIFASESSRKFAQQILEARLREELRRGNAPRFRERCRARLDAAAKSSSCLLPTSEVASRSAKPVACESGPCAGFAPATDRKPFPKFATSCRNHY